jgi:hypothetical protein
MCGLTIPHRRIPSRLKVELSEISRCLAAAGLKPPPLNQTVCPVYNRSTAYQNRHDPSATGSFQTRQLSADSNNNARRCPPAPLTTVFLSQRLGCWWSPKNCRRSHQQRADSSHRRRWFRWTAARVAIRRGDRARTKGCSRI